MNSKLSMATIDGNRYRKFGKNLFSDLSFDSAAEIMLVDEVVWMQQGRRDMSRSDWQKLRDDWLGKRTAYVQQIAERESELAELREFVERGDRLHELKGSLGSELLKNNGRSNNASSDLNSPRRSSEMVPGETRFMRIERILKEAGEPLGAGDITLRLQEMGDGLSQGSTGKFYNSVDAALRTGMKKGWFTRHGHAQWVCGKTPVTKRGRMT